MQIQDVLIEHLPRTMTREFVDVDRNLHEIAKATMLRNETVPTAHLALETKQRPAKACRIHDTLNQTIECKSRAFFIRLMLHYARTA